MKTVYKEIIFKNGSDIQVIPSCEETIRSKPKIPIFFARGISKPATSFIQILEYLCGNPLAKEEKAKIWNMFYGGE